MVDNFPVVDGMENKADIYKLPTLDLTNDVDVETAAKHLFRECSHHLELNYKRYCDQKDEAALMQIRIGMRRTRVAMKAFRFIIHPETYKNFYRELRSLGQLLGYARDMDVFLKDMLREPCSHAGLEKVHAELRTLANVRREDEYRLNQREIMGGRFEAQLQAMEEWRTSDWSLHLGRMGTTFLKEPVNSFALKVMEKGRLNLLSRGAYIDELSSDELHTVRKYVKRSRYHLRFFASLFDSRKMTEGYDLLIQMQDSLGHINDVKEGLKLISELGGEVRADNISDTLRLMSAIIANAGEEVESHLKTFKNLWHRYEEFDVTEADLR